MARKPTQPALYELIRHKPRNAIVPISPSRPPSAAETPRSVRGASVPAAPQLSVSASAASTSAGMSAAAGSGHGPGGVSGPGRFVKIPVRYAYVAVGVALAALVIVYMYGFSAGESAAAKRFEERRIEEMQAQGNLPPVDPMKAGRLPNSLSNGLSNGGQGAGNGGNGPGGGGGVDGGGDRTAEGAGDGTDLGPPPGTDPRQAGLNYFVLAGRLGALEGEPMVRFCRKNGLDAHLVPDDNAKLRLLIVCPGFAAGERQSAPVKALESKIREVGRKWKNAGSGNRDFGDLYPKKHKA